MNCTEIIQHCLLHGRTLAQFHSIVNHGLNHWDISPTAPRPTRLRRSNLGPPFTKS